MKPMGMILGLALLCGLTSAQADEMRTGTAIVGTNGKASKGRLNYLARWQYANHGMIKRENPDGGAYGYGIGPDGRRTGPVPNANDFVLNGGGGGD